MIKWWQTEAGTHSHTFRRHFLDRATPATRADNGLRFQHDISPLRYSNKNCSVVCVREQTILPLCYLLRLTTSKVLKLVFRWMLFRLEEVGRERNLWRYYLSLGQHPSECQTTLDRGKEPELPQEKSGTVWDEYQPETIEILFYSQAQKCATEAQTFLLNSALSQTTGSLGHKQPAENAGAETSMQDMCVLHWYSPGCLGERPWLVDGFGTCWQDDLNERSTKENRCLGARNWVSVPRYIARLVRTLFVVSCANPWSAINTCEYFWQNMFTTIHISLVVFLTTPPPPPPPPAPLSLPMDKYQLPGRLCTCLHWCSKIFRDAPRNHHAGRYANKEYQSLASLHGYLWTWVRPTGPGNYSIGPYFNSLTSVHAWHCT